MIGKSLIKQHYLKKQTNKQNEFYSNLYVKDITDAGYMHVKRVCKDFEIKKFR